MRFIIFFVILLGVVSVNNSWATPEFAVSTGQHCALCHVDFEGSGRLTKFGQAFKVGGYRYPLLETERVYSNLTPFKRGFFTLVGIIHIIAGFIWFGAVLYIHLIMTPSSIVRGIPRSEKLLGWSTIPLVGVTGVVLTLHRIYRLEQFFNSKFGIILLIKIICYLLLLVSGAYVTLYLNKKLRPATKTTKGKKVNFHLNELAQYDGKGGNPAYIGYKGKVYDVSQSMLWDGGTHMQRHFAGQEFTQQVLEGSPHREEMLTRVACIGKLIATATPVAEDKAQRIFLTLAYLNLGLVMVVLVCLGLWRFL